MACNSCHWGERLTLLNNRKQGRQFLGRLSSPDPPYESPSYLELPYFDFPALDDLISPLPTPPQSLGVLHNVPLSDSDESGRAAAQEEVGLTSYVKKVDNVYQSVDCGCQERPCARKSQPLHHNLKEIDLLSAIDFATGLAALCDDHLVRRTNVEIESWISAIRHKSQSSDEIVKGRDLAKTIGHESSHHTQPTSQITFSPVRQHKARGVTTNRRPIRGDSTLEVSPEFLSHKCSFSDPVPSLPMDKSRPSPSDVRIVVSKQTLNEARTLHQGKELYIIQDKPDGFPSVPLWSINSSLEKSLKSATFSVLPVERKNRVLTGVFANFRFLGSDRNAITDSNAIIGGTSQRSTHQGNQMTDRIAEKSTDLESIATLREDISAKFLGGKVTSSSQSPFSNNIQNSSKPGHSQHTLQASLRHATTMKENMPAIPSDIGITKFASGERQAQNVVRNALPNNVKLEKDSRSIERQSNTARASPQQTRIVPETSKLSSFHSHPSRVSPSLESTSNTISSGRHSSRNHRHRPSPPMSTVPKVVQSKTAFSTRILPPSSNSASLRQNSDQPFITSHAHPRPQTSLQQSTASSGSPSRLSVVITSPRRVDVSDTSQPSKLRVELPASTPEKILSSQIPNGFASNLSHMPKKRGRPFASKESEHRAILKAAGKTNDIDNQVRRKPGRPPKEPTKHIEVASPEWKFPVFRCKFAGCIAELANADTLRKHIFAVHGPKKNKATDRKSACLWEGCYELADDQPDIKVEGVPRLKHSPQLKRKTEFDSLADWKSHIETVHMWYILWTQGDGPKSQDMGAVKRPKSLYEREPWLFDKNGTQITPTVDITNLYRESPKEHYAKLFRRTRIDGTWIYHLKEDQTPLYPNKKSKLPNDDEEDTSGNQTPTWEDVPEDIGNAAAHLGQVCL